MDRALGRSAHGTGPSSSRRSRFATDACAPSRLECGSRRSRSPPWERHRRAISVGGTEHFGLPASYPGVRDVDVLIGQHGPHVRAMPVVARATSAGLAVPGVRHRVLAFAEKRVRGSTGGPDEEARRNSSSTVVALTPSPSRSSPGSNPARRRGRAWARSAPFRHSRSTCSRTGPARPGWTARHDL